MKKIYILLTLYFLTIGCSGLSDAGKVLRNEKVITTDEFLVKKRDPLVLPPDYKKIPQPGKAKEDDNTDKKIKEILTVQEEQKSSGKSSSVEESILKRIGQ